MRRSMWLEGAVLVLGTAVVLGSYDYVKAWFAAPEVASQDATRRERTRINNLANIELTDQDGKKLRFYDDLVHDQIVAITFMYTSCSKTCSLATQNVARARELIATYTDKPVRFISMTVDPERDGPAELKRFAAAQGLSPSWQLVTGAPEDLATLRRKLGVYDPDPVVDGDAASHAGVIILGNEPTGRWMKVPALVNPVRIQQAVERVMLPPEKWARGREVIEAVPLERVPGPSANAEK